MTLRTALPSIEFRAYLRELFSLTFLLIVIAVVTGEHWLVYPAIGLSLLNVGPAIITLANNLD